MGWVGNGVLHFILVSEHRFRRFYKMILKLFIHALHFHIKDDVTLMWS